MRTAAKILLFFISLWATLVLLSDFAYIASGEVMYSITVKCLITAAAWTSFYLVHKIKPMV